MLHFTDHLHHYYILIIHILCPFITNIVIGFRYFHSFILSVQMSFFFFYYYIVLASSGGM